MEQEALQFIRALQGLYLEQRDMEHVLGAIGEHTSWIGTGQHEICKNFDEAAQALWAEKAECQGGFIVTGSWYETELLSSDACVVYGEFWAEAKDSSADMASLHHRVSAVCARTAEGMKLLHLHMSRPDDDQGQREYYVKNHTRFEHKNLRVRYEQATKTLHSRDREMEVLTANIPGGVHQTKCDTGLTILSMSSGFLHLFGYSEQEIEDRFQNQFLNMVYEGDRAAFSASIVAQRAAGTTVEYEYRVRCKDGTLMWVLDRGRLVIGEDGSESYFCMMMDTTERKQEQEKLRLMLQRHRVIMNQTTDIIFEWDMQSDTIDFSDNWERKFGYRPISDHIRTAIPHSENIHPEDMHAFLKIMEEAMRGLAYVETEFRIRSLAREYTWCRIRATTQFGSDGKPVKAVGVIIDIDEEKNRSRALMEAAQRDALTKLYNKNVTKQKTGALIYERNEGMLHALMIIDVDNFKQVNDTFGHQCGDAVLANMAQALKRLFRATDVIGRIGGDEFLVFMPNVSNRELVAEKAEAIVKIFNEMPTEIYETISCSVGVALYPKDGIDYDGLSRCADKALYGVKHRGKGDFAFYDRDLCENVHHLPTRTAINGTIDSEENDLANQELIQQIFKMLYDAEDMTATILHIIETVGRAYGVSRAYIFENSVDGTTCSNTFEWCNDGISPERDSLQNLSFERDLAGFFDVYDENGVFYCQDITTLTPQLRTILEQQGIVSVLQCFIKDGSVVHGYVGFDECTQNRYWTKEQVRTLSNVANVLSTFLLKQRFKERLAELCGEQERKTL